MPESKKIGPFRFFESNPDVAWRNSKAWAVAKTSSPVGDLDSWQLTVQEPDRSDSPTLPLHDLKRWVLHGDQPDRFLMLGSREGATDLRRINREQAMRAFLRELIERLPAHAVANNLSLMMPALDDDAVRSRYLKILEEVAPDARVLSEPEMVVEYFRLVRRSLKLDPAKNNIVLVIDIGASTSDLSIVVTNRGGEVIGGKTTRRREARLQAIQGGCEYSAGQWVDEQLLRIAGIDIQDKEDQVRLDLLRQIEKVKIQVSLTRRTTVFRKPGGGHFDLTVAHLEYVSSRLIERLKPKLETMSERLWHQQTGTDEAALLSQDVRRERGVVNERNALQLVDFVVLAGGASRLPGFRQGIQNILLPGKPEISEVGSDFPVAAALGGLAHQLVSKYQPPKLRLGEARWETEARAISGGLDSDLLFGWKPTRKDPERREILVPKGDPIVYEGGTRSGILTLPVNEGTEIHARLISSSRKERQGAGLRQLQVRHSSPVVGVEIDSNHRASIQSDGLGGSAALVLDLHHLGISNPSSRSAEDKQVDLATNHVRFDRAEEIVVDFGMSKTVMVASEGGDLDPSDLESMFSATFDNTSGIDHEITRVEPKLWTKSSFAEQLLHAHTSLQEHGTYFPLNDLACVLLASAVRPIVVLAGPPGAGKSMMVRLVARLLGTRPNENFIEVAVQAHWENDEPLFGTNSVDGGLLRNLVDTPFYQVILFDEFNLTRPEFYMSRLFAALDQGQGTIDEKQIAPCSIYGTMNVDDTSRPPSPKVVDRSFLVELEPPSVDSPISWNGIPEDLQELGSPQIQFSREAKRPWNRVVPILKAIEDAVHTQFLRSDLLPSRRALQDIQRFLYLHAELGIAKVGAMSEDEAIDRALLGRILTRFSGAAEQIEPVLEAVDSILPQEFIRCRSRLELAKRQISFGFVSPWQ